MVFTGTIEKSVDTNLDQRSLSLKQLDRGQGQSEELQLQPLGTYGVAYRSDRTLSKCSRLTLSSRNWQVAFWCIYPYKIL